MNGLSWILYLADMSNGLRTLGQIVGTFGAIGAVGLGIGAVVYKTTVRNAENPNPYGKASKAVFIVAIVAMILAVVSPSRQTMMLIAASEVGERLIASEQAQAIGGEAGDLALDSMRVLRKFINEQLDAPVSEPDAE